MLLHKEEILKVLNGLTEAVENDDVQVMKMGIDAEFKTVETSDFDGFEMEHVDTGIRILTIKYDSRTLSTD